MEDIAQAIRSTIFTRPTLRDCLHTYWEYVLKPDHQLWERKGVLFQDDFVRYYWVMLLGEDFIIEEPIPDLFAWTNVKELACVSNHLHFDCRSICCYDVQFTIKLIVWRGLQDRGWAGQTNSGIRDVAANKRHNGKDDTEEFILKSRSLANIWFVPIGALYPFSI